MARKMTFSEIPVKAILYKTFDIIFNNERVITVFCKQPVYKHLYGLSPFFLFYNKYYKLKKSGVLTL